MTNEIAELSTDLNVITAEINSYQQIAGQAIFEIGRRLKHVKETDLVHGQFGKWLGEIGISTSQANRFMKVFDELGESKFLTSRKMGVEALYYIATIPEEERTKTHTIPSTGKSKPVDEMTVRELKEVKEALKKAEKRAELAERDADISKRQIERLENQPPKVEVKTEYIELTDDTALERLQRYEEQFGDIDNFEQPKVFRINNETEINGLALAFSSEVREFLRKYSYLRHYNKELATVNDTSLAEYTSSIEALRDFINEVGRVVSRTDTNTIIEMEAI